MRRVIFTPLSLTLLAYALLGLSRPAAAAIRPEDVTQKLVAAFAVERPSSTPTTAIHDRTYVGFQTRTITFGIGASVYRIVFSSDGSITVGLMREGDIAAQPLWQAKTGATTVDQIVNVVYSREFGKVYNSKRYADERKGPQTDKAPERKTDHRQALRWNQLMNQVLRGEGRGLSSSFSAGNMDQAVALARTLEPCASNRNDSPQREAMLNLTQALAAIEVGFGELWVDRSREYEKKGKYAFLKELDAHGRQPRPEEALRLIRQSASDAHALFTAAAHSPQIDPKDPYAVAARQNFQLVARAAGEAGGALLVGQVLARTSVNIEGFTERRRSTPSSSVIYDRTSNQYFVDPTLNSPSEARYLLSLAVYYEWKLTQHEVQRMLARYSEVRKTMAVIEQALLDENDEKQLISLRKESNELSERLFALAQQLRNAPTHPTF